MIDGYRIGRTLSMTGQGKVKIAENTYENDQRVAIKIYDLSKPQIVKKTID